MGGSLDKGPEGSVFLVEGSQVHIVSIDDIDVEPDPVRERLDETHVRALAQSISELGQMEPGLAEEIEGSPRVKLLAGRHRHAALRLLGAPSMLLRVTPPLSAEARLVACAVENAPRLPLTPFELGMACRLLRDRHGYSARSIAARMGVDQGRVRALLLCHDVLPKEGLKAFRAIRNIVDERELCQIAALGDPIAIEGRLQEWIGWRFHGMPRREPLDDLGLDRSRRVSMKSRKQVHGALGEARVAVGVWVDGRPLLLDERTRAVLVSLLSWISGKSRRRKVFLLPEPVRPQVAAPVAAPVPPLPQASPPKRARQYAREMLAQRKKHLRALAAGRNT